MASNDKHFNDLQAAISRNDGDAAANAVKEIAKTDPAAADAILSGGIKAGTARLFGRK